MKRFFSEHPRAVGETYLGHMRSALSFSVPMFVGAFACLIHAFLPSLFKTAGSRRIIDLHDRMVVNRSRLERAVQSAPFQAAER